MSETVATKMAWLSNNGSAAGSEAQYLLSDAQVEKFIIDGYLLVHTDFPAAFHVSICEQIDAVFAEVGGNPGNEILERVPDLYQVYTDPCVRGALVSLMGPDYTRKSG